MVSIQRRDVLAADDASWYVATSEKPLPVIVSTSCSGTQLMVNRAVAAA